MLRDIILAFSFGTHESLAAFFVAFRLTHLMRRLFGEGALQSAFVPLFEELRAEDSGRSYRFFRDLSALWIVLLTLISGVGMALLWVLPQFFALPFGMAEVCWLMLVMMPSLLPVCLFGLNISFLQCQRRYFTSSVAPVFFNIVLIIAAWILRGQDPGASMLFVAGSVVVACFAQWLVSFIPVLSYGRQFLGASLLKSVQLFSADVKRLWKPLSLGLLGIGASQINNAIDAVFARISDAEGPAQLWFAIRFQQLPLALVGIALSSAILPPLSRAFQTQDSEKYLRFLGFGIRQVIALLTPCTMAFLVLGVSMINCIYGHGGFHSQSVIATAGCLHGYALALIPMGIILVLAPAWYAQKNYLVPLRGACISLVLNLVLNSLMVFGFGWKAMSVAIATSISSWVNAWYLYSRLTAKIGPIFSSSGVVQCCKSVATASVAACVPWAGLQYFGESSVFFSCGTLDLPSDLLSQLVHLIVPSLAFVCVFVVCAVLFRAEDLFVFLRKGKLHNYSFDV
jgi:putative peptidoglycan lipid II flippase